MKDLGKIRGDIVFSFLISLSVVVLDQLSKYFFKSQFSSGQSLPIIKNIFHLTLVYNTGIAFGLFKSQTALFIVLSAIAIFLVAFNIYNEVKRQQIDRVNWIGLSLILGGAIGNLIDRLSWGFVIDFLDFRIWPVFNIADSCITVGVILMLIRCIPLFAK
ncbi:MAG: signal peptidase II [Candidatus Omnitrophota bacterium]|nr:signal peptidase II [Candidatus Omnitrophota bacterium]